MRPSTSFKRVCYGLSCALLAVGLILIRPVYAADTSQQPDIQSLRTQIQQLRERVRALEGRLREVNALQERIRKLESELAQQRAKQGGDQIAAKEAASEPEAKGKPQGVKFGGALRFNYSWKDFSEGAKTRRGDAGLDIFRINADGKIDDILVSAEYRFYPYMSAIHHGWIGYDFGGGNQIQGGITKVPFGLLPYASHNYWFGIPFYIGLADNYDTGLKYVHDRGPWNAQLAFFKNGELGDAANLERYSYDPVAVGAARNEKTNTLSARLAYTFGKGTQCHHELGASGQWGELYNRDTNDTGHDWAAAGHLDSRCGRWNFQLELGRYEYHPRNPAGVPDDTVTLGAYLGSFPIAARAKFAVANVAYVVPVNWPHVKQITCYNDFSMLDKDQAGASKSYLNTTGCGVGIGPTFTYIDIIRGRNMIYFGNGSLAGGGSNDWNTRVNINIGYYW